MNIKVNKDIAMTIRELAEGTHFIQVGHFRRASCKEAAVYDVRVRTSDPYRSKTILGTQVRTFPSERAFIVEVEGV